MMIRGLCLLLALSMSGDATAGQEPAPDTSAILRLIGRYGSAHACPISNEVALTNAHVIDVRPFDRDAPLIPYAWGDGDGNTGLLIPVYAQQERDLAVGKGRFPRFYPRATKPPEVGEHVWFLGYRWDGEHFFQPRIIRAKVLRVVAGHVVYEPGGQPGSSGSCVLNAQGQLVAINAFSNLEGNSGAGVGVWEGIWALRELRSE